MTQTIDFSTLTVGSFLDAVAGVSLLVAPANVMRVATGGNIDNAGQVGDFTTQGFAVLTVPVGAETIESITVQISANGVARCAGGILSAGTAGTGAAQIVNGYVCGVNNSLTDFGIYRYNLTTGAYETRYFWTLPSGTLPWTATKQTVGGVVQLGVFQNGVQVGAYQNDTGSPYTAVGTKYGVFITKNAGLTVLSGKLILGPAAAVAGPTNTTLPTITGTAQAGAVLVVASGTWSSTGTITHQWNAAGAAIAGATGSTYVPATADVGKTITVTETNTQGGFTPSATSAATAVIIAAAAAPAPGPLKFYHGAYNVDETSLQSAWNAGFRVVSYDQYDFNGNSLAAANSWDAQRKNLRDNLNNVITMPAYLVPGLTINNTFLPDVRDLTSLMDRALRDPTVLAFATTDEPGTVDRRTTSNPAGPFAVRQSPDEMIAYRKTINDYATANGLTKKPFYCNDTQLTYMNPSHAGYMNCAALDWFGSDYYPVALGLGAIFGTYVGGFDFSATQAGTSAWRATKQPTNSVTLSQDRTHGGHYIAFGQMGAERTDGKTPTVAQTYILSWDPIINGAGGLLEFVTNTTNFTWNYNFMYTPWNTEFQGHLDLLQARGHLMAPGGGRTPSDTRHSPVADNGDGSGTVAVGYTGPWRPITDGTTQIQGGFTSAKFYSPDRTTWTTLILNMLNVDQVLNDNIAGGYGITGMSFPANRPIKAFASTDTAFATDLFAGTLAAAPGWGTHTGTVLTRILNLLPDVPGQPRTLSGHSVLTGEVTANANVSALLYGAVFPIKGNGTTGGINVTLSEPIAGASPRVTVLTATITA